MSAASPGYFSGMRLLGITAIATAAVMISGVIAIALLGSGEAGDPRFELSLDQVNGEREGLAVAIPVGRASRSVNKKLVSDLALIEETAEGALPKIAEDGRTPMTAYARPISPTDKRPRIAVVVGRVGVSESLTSLALARLPPGVSLSLVPFISNVQTIMDRARGSGHEVLLEIPMEPIDYPDSNPGPNALLIATGEAENIKRMNRSLGSVTGYVGITSLQGGRFMSELDALQPVLNEASRRGLMFFDNGTLANSMVLTGARRAAATIAIGSVQLDAVQTPEAIDNQLADHQMQAIQSGFAIGSATAFPLSIERIALWAERLEERGYALVSISHLAVKPDLALAR